jgi:hypothetical protein
VSTVVAAFCADMAAAPMAAATVSKMAASLIYVRVGSFLLHVFGLFGSSPYLWSEYRG